VLRDHLFGASSVRCDQYLNYTYDHQAELEGVTISAYQEGV